jgi:hypothetical protein
MEFTVRLTGWNGHISLRRLKLPNWLAVLAATALAAFCWLRATSVWPAPLGLLFGLAVYGLLHAGYAMVSLMMSSKGSADVGAFLTFAGFVAILLGLVREVGGPKIRAPAKETLQPGGPA